MKSEIEIPRNAMDYFLDTILPWMLGVIATIILAVFGFLFNRYIKSIDDKFSTMMTSFTDTEKKLDSLENMMNQVLNEQSKLDYRMIFSEDSIKDLMKRQAEDNKDIALLKSFHQQHHKDDRFNK